MSREERERFEQLGIELFPSGSPDMVCGRGTLLLQAAILVITVSGSTMWNVSGLGSMSSIAVSYGENGPVFCGLSVEGTHQVTCYGADASIVYGAPSRLPFLGLTAGDGFVCGLLMDTRQPYCWGNNNYVNMGVPQPMVEGASYSEISAGDHHLCGVRRPCRGASPNNNNTASSSFVDCWGYNMTAAYTFPWSVRALTAGSSFNCALSVPNQTVSCWGDETGSSIFTSAPKYVRYRTISAGGFHVCGVREDYSVGCWGQSWSMERMSPESLGEGDVELTPADPMVAVVGGKFHACGIRWADRSVVCWGFRLASSVPPPEGIKVYAIAAGDYFTCGVLAERSLKPVCWGTGFPMSIPMAVSPGLCISSPCGPGFYEFTREKVELCKSPDSRVCLPCSNTCPVGTYQFTSCNSMSDRRCEYNCSSCATPECSTFCTSSSQYSKTRKKRPSLQLPIVVAELVFAAVLVSAVSVAACLYVRHKLRSCTCSATLVAEGCKNRPPAYPFHKDQTAVKVRPDLEELRIRRARTFSYEELERATRGFCEESQVGRGSFSCVFKGVLRDGTVVAVKRAIVAADLKKNSKEFRTELDLLSRLNHAHLLNLLGYCEEGGERLLVYEFMAHGSLHQHLHGKDPRLKEQLDWVRRVTIAVQAARGIEYLHGYACPPVIHRDIKSSNILIDEEHNARVADFGLSLLGPADSSCPLSELPAGTLGYLDPEYYRLHYLTTKSDVYSFGVLLLEILSGRKAIDMQYEEGNIVEWAAPLIKAGDITGILDPVLSPPAPEIEALKRIAATACKCVRMRGKERPSMDKVTTALERALALLMGGPCNDQPILPTEVVLGSSRLHKKEASQRSSNRSCSENDMAESEDQRFEFRAPSWITFPSVTSSQRRKSSVSTEADVADLKNPADGRNHGNSTAAAGVDGLRCLEEEIGPASPQEDLFLQHNF